MRIPEIDEDLTGKVGICSVGRVGVITGPSVLKQEDGTQLKGWCGLGLDGKGNWFSSSPVITAETAQLFHDRLSIRFGGKMSYHS